MTKLSLKDLTIKDKTVLMRVDFNVPLNKEGQITDDTRIVAALPSIHYVLNQGGALVLMSHLGRPKDKKVAELTLAPCAKRLSELLHQSVTMAPDCVGDEVSALVKTLKPCQVLLLENLRFHRGEEHPEEDPDFVKQLAQLGDIYVNDAFGTAHRAHASTAKITQFFPEKSATGFLMQKEIEFLGSTLLSPERPFYAMIGGAKISSKIGVIKSLLQKVDALFIGGGMAYTFYKAQGLSIGNSIHEDDFLQEAREILKHAQECKCPIFLPLDNVIAPSVDESAESLVIQTKNGIPEGYEGLDIGPETIKEFSQKLEKAKTILWNGPLGVFEVDAFAKGTEAIARTLAESQAITIVGGGDSIAALQKCQLAEKVTHISTGGGASLEYIEYGSLPGIEVLTEKKV